MCARTTNVSIPTPTASQVPYHQNVCKDNERYHPHLHSKPSSIPSSMCARTMNILSSLPTPPHRIFACQNTANPVPYHQSVRRPNLDDMTALSHDILSDSWQLWNYWKRWSVIISNIVEGTIVLAYSDVTLDCCSSHCFHFKSVCSAARRRMPCLTVPHCWGKALE